jgi:hypothetical protein
MPLTITFWTETLIVTEHEIEFLVGSHTIKAHASIYQSTILECLHISQGLTTNCLN